ncbi:MAG: hypothetical protein R3F59_25595 [Myxococcota bacterium]
MLESLYRARCGDKREQVENFLSAALGQLLSCSPGARAAVGPLFGVPADGELRIATEEPLYGEDEPEPAGRVDLRFDFRKQRAVRSVVVENKVGAAADALQLRRYADALGRRGRVVLLSNRPDDGRIAERVDCTHVTWEQVARALQPMQSYDALARHRVEHLAKLGASAPPAQDAGALMAETSSIHRRFDHSVKLNLPLLLPTGARAGIPDAGYADLEAGYCLEADDEHRSDLSVDCIGLTADRAGLGALQLTLWTRTAHRKLADALVATGAWEPYGEYLLTEVGTFWGDDALWRCLRDGIGRGRQLLRAPAGRDWAGLWSSVRQSFDLAHQVRGTVDELWQALEAEACVSASARALSGYWLQGLHRALDPERCGPVTRYHGGSFYVDKRFQVGARLVPGEGTASVQAWADCKRQGRVDAFSEAMGRAGWTRSSTKPGTVHPPLDADDVIDADTLDTWTAALATAIEEAPR